ncbi:MAG TPA: SDR family oxidoreductase [Actinocrinis sp.]|nr:SDR family oxidoreductase [Actinocrinis sp.]
MLAAAPRRQPRISTHLRRHRGDPHPRHRAGPDRAVRLPLIPRTATTFCPDYGPVCGRTPWRASARRPNRRLPNAPTHTLYAAAKGAISSTAVNAAQELGPRGIRVNAVAPGTIDTEMLAPFPPESLVATAANTPLGRIGTPDDIASAVVFLAGDGASFITGQVLGVDGGLK